MALLPNFWWPIGPTVTLTQNTDPEFRQKGPYSAKIVGNKEVPPDPDADTPIAWVPPDGITTSPFRISPTVEFPHFAEEFALKLTAGKARAEVWDVTGAVAGDPSRPLVVWPSRESGVRAVTDRLNVWVEDLYLELFEDMWRGGGGEESTHLQLAVLCEEDATTFYLDGAQCVNWGEAARIFYEGRAANDLFLAGVQELARVGSPISSYSAGAIDLARLDDVHHSTEGLIEGADAIIMAPGLDPQDTVTRRVLVVVDNPFTAEPSRVTLETNVDSIARRQARAGFRRRQSQRLVRVPVPESIPDAVARLTTDQLSVRALPVPGQYKTQLRLQGPGATADDRWDAGEIVASELGTTIELTTDQLPATRPLLLTMKSLGPTGLECRTPFEVSVIENVIEGAQRLPIDESLVLYWPLEELGQPTLPPQCSPIDIARFRGDAGPYGNHGYIYTWDFGDMVSPGPGASGMCLEHSDPLGANWPSGQVVVDSDPTAQAPAAVPDDQGDFDICTDITMCGAFRPWLQDIDLCAHTHYDLWGRFAPGGGVINGHTFEEAGFFFGLTEYEDTLVGFQPGLRMIYYESTPTQLALVWPFDWSYGQIESLRGSVTGSALSDTWIFVCQRISDDGAGGVNVDVFVGDLLTTILTKLDPASLTQSSFANAYGVDPVKDLTLKTTRWTFLHRGQTAEDREVCQISADGFLGLADEHRRWNRALSDAEVYGQFLDLSGQKPADQVFQVP